MRTSRLLRGQRFPVPSPSPNAPRQMDPIPDSPIPDSAVPSDLPAPGESGACPEPVDPAIAPSTSSAQAPAQVPQYAGSGSGILPYLPVSRHHRPSDAEVAEGGAIGNGRFVRFTIAFTLLFVLAMTALIWYRWYPVSLPSSSIVFMGDESLDGAVATVSQNGRECYSITLDKKNDYMATVWVSPGSYDLLVTRKNRVVVQRATVGVMQMQSVVDPLSTRPGNAPVPANDPTTQPSTSGQ